jgi:hypothetical protein
LIFTPGGGFSIRINLHRAMDTVITRRKIAGGWP